MSFTQVRAILRDSCEHCHNEETAEGSLVLKSYDTLIAGGESGNPIVPGKSASSLLVQAIDGRVKPRMPYKEDPLSEAEIDTIRRWIDAGAPAPSAAEAASDEREGRDSGRPAHRSGQRSGVRGGIRCHGATDRGRLVQIGPRLVRRRQEVDPLARRARRPGARARVLGRWHTARGGRGASGGVGEVRIWDVQQTPAKSIATIQGHKDAILSVAFSPDGSTIATGSYDKLVKLWDAATGKELRTFKEHSDAVYSVAFLPGGTQLVSGAGDRTLKIWDVQRGTRLFTISDALDAIYAVAVHPSGTRLAAAGADRMIRTWTWNGDVASAAGPGATLLTSAFAHGDAILGLAYSPGGDALVSAGADRTIKIWDASTLGEKRLLEPQPDWVLGLALSGDGHWLAAGRYDGTLGLYSLENGGAGEQFVVPAARTK